jgi:hypothetical protein
MFMNQLLSYLRRGVVPVVTIVAFGALLTACSKNKNENIDIPAAGVMAVNLAPDQQSIVVALNGNSLTNFPLGYAAYTGGYQAAYVGTRTIQAYDYPNNSPLTTDSFTFNDGKYYSVFVIGSNGRYRNVVAEDKLDSLSASNGNAYLRFVNAIADSAISPAVTITAAGNSVVNENASYGALSEFKAVSPGEVAVAVKSGATVDATRTITVEANKIYTILLAGVPGATDDVQKVQIRFIQNGVLTENTGN